MNVNQSWDCFRFRITSKQSNENDSSSLSFLLSRILSQSYYGLVNVPKRKLVRILIFPSYRKRKELTFFSFPFLSFPWTKQNLRVWKYGRNQFPHIFHSLRKVFFFFFAFQTYKMIEFFLSKASILLTKRDLRG